MAALISALLPTLVAITSNPQAASAGTSTATENPNADGGQWSGTFTTTGSCGGSGYVCLDDYPDSSGTTVVMGPNKANGWFDTKFSGTGTDVGNVTSVDVAYYAKDNSSGVANGMDTINVTNQLLLSDENTAITASTTSAALTTSYALYTTTLTPNGLDISKTTADNWELRIGQTYTAVSTHDTTAKAYIASVQLTVHYNTASGTLTQSGYIFENDDQASAANANSDTAQVAGNTAITGVKKGERVNLRTQLKDATNTTSSNLGLFYDRNDNYWTKVKSSATAITSSGSCNDTNFACTVLAGHYTTAPEMTSDAVAPNGTPWVSFYDSNAADLIVANYVGSGGSGCGANGSSAWNCVTVASTGDVGQYSKIAIDTAGNVWVAYYDKTNTKVMAAENVAGSGCASSAWTCTIVDTRTLGASANGSMGLTIGGDGNPWLDYLDTSGSYWMARYVGSGGTGCSVASWTGCSAEQVDDGGGLQASIAIGPNSQPWAMQAANHMFVYQYVGGAGGCGHSLFTCYMLDTTNSVEFPAMAIAPDGNPWASWHDTTNNVLKVSNYVGSGGNCPGDALFNCTNVDDTTSIGAYTSIAFDPVGHAWVVYKDATNNRLRLARYVGSGGSGCKSGVTTWTCSTIDSVSAKDIGNWNSLAFGPDGTAWLSTVNATDKDVRVINLNHGGEMLTSPGLGGNANGVSISSSHADMTSVGDSGNQSDADCIGGGTWTNGKWSESEEASGVSIPAGDCTEVGFMLDTSQAQASTTYRFVASTKDSTNYSRSFWRGPGTISQTPTLTTEAATTTRYSKDSTWDPGNCSDTNWTCANVIDADVNGSSDYSMAFAPDGTPWASFNYGGASVWVAQYVGGSAGGTSCNIDGGGQYSQAWLCTKIDNDNLAPGEGMSLAFAPDGTPWLTYLNTGSTGAGYGRRVAHYVGSGGSGCAFATTTWSCETVFSEANNDTQGTIAIGSNGTIWTTFADASYNVWVARYVASGGTGCYSSTWTCEKITSGAGSMPFVAIDNNNNPWIVWNTYNGSTRTLKYGRYVGAGGGSCPVAAVTDWSCGDIKTTAGTGDYPSLAFDSNNTAWVSSVDAGLSDVLVAKYVGSGGGGDSCVAAGAWTCVQLANSGGDASTSIAVDATGAPWVAYDNNTNGALRIARCTSSCTSGTPSFSTTDVDTVDNPMGWNLSLAFDRSGRPWVFYDDYQPSYIKVANLRLPPSRPSISSFNNPGRSAGSGSDLRYHLDAGLSPRTSTCAATANYQGYCGVVTDDSAYDSMASAAYESPMYEFSSRTASNASFPSYQWKGQSSIAASTNNVKIEVYRFGSTNAWVTLATNSAASANSNFTLTGTASAGSASEYWEADGSNYWTYYRVYQASGSSAETVKTQYFGSAGNNPPSAPSALAQYKSDGTTSISTGGWTNQTQVILKGTVSDPDSDNTSLCVEVAAAFSSPASPTPCGTAVTSGTTASVNPTGLSSGTTYKWQAKAEDSHSAYSTSYTQFNSGSAAFSVDTAAPTTGTAYDGSSAGVESGFNNGSLSSLSCNWSGFSDALSGVASYDYSFGTTAGGTDILGWTNVGSGTTNVTASSLTLHTSQIYYCNVRANDVAGNQSSAVSSSGQLVAPTLTFSTSTNAVTLPGLNLGNGYTSTQTMTLTTSTNAYNGYSVHAYETQALTAGSQTIADYTSPASAPTTWSGTGFGYTVSGGSAVAAFSGSKYAHFGSSASPDTPVSHAGTISGNPISNEQETVGVKVVASSNQAAGTYTTHVVWSCLPVY